jgi:hypothetical protein
MKNLICVLLIAYACSSLIQVHKPDFLLLQEFKNEFDEIQQNSGIKVLDLGNYDYPKDDPK